jgi:rfaE bifunctional protein nucleotidyltransferase chain/domain
MNRALFVDVACFTDDRREDRLLGRLGAEFLPLPVVAERVRWHRLDPGLAIDLSASWLLADARSAAVHDPSLPRRLARCVAVGGAGRPGWSTAPDLRGALALVGRALRESRLLTDYRSIERVAGRLRAAGRRIVFTNGVFDLFHPGHLRLLEEAAKLGDALIVGVNSDESAARLKGKARPVIGQFARAGIVAAARPVDWAVVFVEDTPLEILRLVRPHVLVKGGEYRLSQVVGARLVRGWGGEVAIVEHAEGWSASEIVRRIRGKSR